MVAPMAATSSISESLWCSFFSTRHELPATINSMPSNVLSLILLAFPIGHMDPDDRVRWCIVCVHWKFVGPHITSSWCFQPCKKNDRRYVSGLKNERLETKIEIIRCVCVCEREREREREREVWFVQCNRCEKS